MQTEVVGQDPPWLKIARAEIGVKEVPGQKHSLRILEYHSATSLHASSDEVPWCASFVNWCLRECRYKGTNSAMARSFMEMPAQLIRPVHGCIVVLWRGKRDSPSGHVAFYESGDRESVLVLGGNQANEVCMKRYPKEMVLGYFWPVIRTV